MRKNKNLFIYAAMFFLAVMVVCSCKKKDDDDDDNQQQTDFEVLSDYLVANDLDLDNMMDGWLVTADEIAANPDNYYILDIRSEGVYDTVCHIEGAVNVAYADVVTEAANANGKQIVVTCYKGQAAAFALIALRLSGYPTAKSLKWGMSSWNEVCDKWTSACHDTIDDYPGGWTNPADITANATFGDPDLTSLLANPGTDGATILAERVDTLLEGYSFVSGPEVLENYTSYFVNCYWDEADVTTYGHITGSYRIKPLTLAGGEMNNLDPSETIVTYCWTGQTSSLITAYLMVLGYDAASLSAGANGMIYSDLTSHTWTGSGSYDCAP